MTPLASLASLYEKARFGQLPIEGRDAEAYHARSEFCEQAVTRFPAILAEVKALRKVEAILRSQTTMMLEHKKAWIHEGLSEGEPDEDCTEDCRACQYSDMVKAGQEAISALDAMRFRKKPVEGIRDTRLERILP